MTRLPDLPPQTIAPPAATGIETIILPRSRDLGGFAVRRVLPSMRRRMVGPFIFLDQMGPVTFPPGEGMDVRPHPHIGLATVTYLLDGTIMHRDSLGFVQPITPGDVNWMTAGRGIVHSERSDTQRRQNAETLSGLQSWVALPTQFEENAPTFTHHAATSLPSLAAEGKQVRLIAGSLFGLISPVPTLSPLFYADISLQAAAKLPLDPVYDERAAYLLDGTVEIDGQPFAAGRLLVFAPGQHLTLRALTPCRLMLLGGAPLDGPRHIWWNLVSSRKKRIEQAKADWQANRMGTVPGETDRIPLPAA